MHSTHITCSKNFTKGYSDIEVKVREATSNDPNGPPTALLEQLASASHQPYAVELTFRYLFSDMMSILDRRLNDKGRNWRHVYKSLIVLDYLLLAGSEQVLIHLREQIYIIKTLLHFQYVDDLGRDHGSCVRQKTKDLLDLIEDPEQVASRRNNSQLMDPHAFLAYNEEKYNTNFGSPRQFSWSSTSSRPTSSTSSSYYRHTSEEDIQLQMALDASRQQAIIDAQKRASQVPNDEDDLEFQAALKISAAEAAKFSSKKSSDDLIDLFQGPPAVSETHRELSMLSAPPPTYYHHASYEFGYPRPNDQPHGVFGQNDDPHHHLSSSNGYPSHISPQNSSYLDEQHSMHASYASDQGFVNNKHPEYDPFSGLSDEVHSPDKQTTRLKRIPQSTGPKTYGAIPPNSAPTPFEIAALAEEEDK